MHFLFVVCCSCENRGHWKSVVETMHHQKLKRILWYFLERDVRAVMVKALNSPTVLLAQPLAHSHGTTWSVLHSAGNYYSQLPYSGHCGLHNVRSICLLDVIFAWDLVAVCIIGVSVIVGFLQGESWLYKRIQLKLL